MSVELDSDANGAIDISKGGTNGTTAEDARTNLDLLAKSGKSGGQTLIGGKNATDALTLQGTSATGTPTSPAIVVLVGDNGSIIAETTLNNGNKGIGTNAPNENAILDVTSTTKAFMPPRMTTTQKNAIAIPTAGMVVYDTDTNKLCIYTGAAWQTVTSS